MRLLCRNCDAEYEVDDGLIPPEGRDVQCSNCMETWFQSAAQKAAEPEPLVPSPAAQKPRVTAEALGILHEEVEREARARAAERAGLETQIDMALEAPRPAPTQPPAQSHAQSHSEADAAPGKPAESARAMPTRAMPGITPSGGTAEGGEPIAQQRAAEPAEHATPAPVTADPDMSAPVMPGAVAQTSRAGGFRKGFAAAVLIAAACAAVYIYADPIAERMPNLADPLAEYVTSVDQARLWLDDSAQDMLRKIR